MKIAPYGSWKSPISAEELARGGIGFGYLCSDGVRPYWTEWRPQEEGRNQIVRQRPDGTTVDLLPEEFSARSRVYEYGGAEFLAFPGTVVFVNEADQRLYRVDGSGEPVPQTPEGPWRFGDGIVDLRRNRTLWVCEDHSQQPEPANLLVSVPLDREGSPEPLVVGFDFVSSPRIDPSGRRLAWLGWNHPNMPWDGTQLWTARFDDRGTLTDAVRVAGGPEESIFQPEWAPDGSLLFVSDRSGWWNLYRWDGETVQPLAPMEAECGRAQWLLGTRTYALLPDGTLYCAAAQEGRTRLFRLDPDSTQPEFLDLPFTQIDAPTAVGDELYFLAASPTEPWALVRYTPTTGNIQIVRRSRETIPDRGYLSVPEPIAYPTSEGDTAYGFYYPPTNRDFQAPDGERPPLIVTTHGGPTGATSDALNLGIQYWTSRGFAVLDVNYRGSTGYGRTYRCRLYGQWGIYDVDDCVFGARYLIERGLADPNRLIVRGGSAGGYTTLAVLAFRDVFHAGASYFGVSDLGALAEETHKFESHYLDQLIGPYPDAADRYRARSPLYHADRISCPVIFLQGTDDRVVPPEQSRAMVAALRERGVPVAYVEYPGERHGFRRPENVVHARQAEHYFYAAVLGLEPADALPRIPIDNWEEDSSENERPA